MAIPTLEDITLDTTSTTSDALRGVLSTNYDNAMAVASYAMALLDGDLKTLTTLLASGVEVDFTAVKAKVDAIDLYVPGTGFTYTAPAQPTFDAVPSYSAPALGTIVSVPGISAALGALDAVPTVSATLGAIAAIPGVDAIDIGVAPDTAITFTNSDFSDDLLAALKTKLTSALTTSSTGLGDAEAALFARETARQNAVRATAYTEATTSFSSKGFDMPPGALLAKQTEINSESTIRLADSSSQIMAESARLAVDYNKTVLSTTSQVVDALARFFDNKIMRDFEAAKATVQFAIEGFKQLVSVALAKADLNKTAITATVEGNTGTVSVYRATVEAEVAAISGVVASNKGVIDAYVGEIQGQTAAINGAVSANEGTVRVFTAEIEGQVAPMKAISESNTSKASAYNAEVQGATSNLNAQVIPEELKLKGVQANAQIATSIAELTVKEAGMLLEVARQDIALKVNTLLGAAQAAGGMIQSAMNSVQTSTSLGYRADASANTNHTYNTNVAYKAPDGTLPVLHD